MFKTGFLAATASAMSIIVVVCLCAPVSGSPVDEKNRNLLSRLFKPGTKDKEAQEADSSSNHQKIRALISKARDFERDEKLPSAVREYQNVLALNNEIPFAHHRLAVLLDTMGRHNEARPHYFAVSRLDPGNAELYCDYGFSLYLQNDYQEAAKNYQHALRLNQNLKRAHNNLGVLYALHGQVESSRQHFAYAGNEAAKVEANLQFAEKIAGTRQNAQLANAHQQPATDNRQAAWQNQQARIQQAREQQLREQKLREQQLQQQLVREQQVRYEQVQAQHVQAQHEQAQHEQAQYEQAQHEQAQYEQAQHEQAQYEQAQYQQAQYERQQYERQQYEQQQYEQQQAQTVSARPVQAQPVQAQPVQARPVQAQPVHTALVRAQPIQTAALQPPAPSAEAVSILDPDFQARDRSNRQQPSQFEPMNPIRGPHVDAGMESNGTSNPANRSAARPAPYREHLVQENLVRENLVRKNPQLQSAPVQVSFGSADNNTDTDSAEPNRDNVSQAYQPLNRSDISGPVTAHFSQPAAPVQMNFSSGN